MALDIVYWRTQYNSLQKSGEGVEMVTGIIKSFDIVYGSGFITPDDGSKDVYVTHLSIECDGLRNLKEGQRVSFEVMGGTAYRYAKCIQILNLVSELTPV